MKNLGSSEIFKWDKGENFRDLRVRNLYFILIFDGFYYCLVLN